MKSILTSRQQNQVKEIFVDAGKILFKMREKVTLSSKNLGSITSNAITEADLASEKFLKEKLNKLFPDFGIYGEESYENSTSEFDKDYVWILDPLDGTLNFSRGLPYYAVGGGLYHHKQAVASVIYFPEFKELYFAFKDQGAYCNKKRIYVSKRIQSAEIMPILSFMRLNQLQQKKFDSFLFSEKLPVRNIGCAFYHVSHTATGQYDVFIGINQAIWDMAAGQCLIEEAGGQFSIIERNTIPDNPYHNWFLAGSSELVTKFTPKIKEICTS